METRTGIVTTTITSMLNNGQRKTLIKKEKIEAKLEAEKGIEILQHEFKFHSAVLKKICFYVIEKNQIII